MKQILLDIDDGLINVEEVPVPVLKNNGVLVRNEYSVISAGTEASTLNFADKSLLGKVKARPDLAKQVWDKVATTGILTTYKQAVTQLAKPIPLGYSSAGVVVESSSKEFKAGDRVACGGAGYANHAEYVYIPQNLCVKIPEGVSSRDACYTTVGSIAMQGVRNAKLSVGENVAVIGLGLIGLLTVEIVKAAGCRVFGVDVDPAKLKLAEEIGADVATNYNNILEKMSSFSPFGADAVIITASTRSNDPISVSGDLVREGGRVVAVGMIGFDLPRDKYYAKEAEVIVSRSYGLGRYDASYEEKGHDYPIRLRWTEKRNMEAFLNLLAEKKISIEPLLTHEFEIDDGVVAYNLLNGRTEPFIGITLHYPDTGKALNTKEKIPVAIATTKSNVKDKLHLGVIGAGSHATSTLLPALKEYPVEFKGIATATGLTAKAVAKTYNIGYCATDYHEILNDKEIDSVLIATRNDMHAGVTIEALKAGKKVYVEKPLATTFNELEEIKKVREETNGYVQVGFNRRYAPYTEKLMNAFKDRSGPMVVHYRVNAGPLPETYWANDAEQGGGMLISECCHFIDYILWITKSKPVEVYAKTIEPTGKQNKMSNLQIVIALEDGSIGTITYTTFGDKSYSKEMVEVFADGTICMLKDFREIEIIKGGSHSQAKTRLTQDKGFSNEFKLFVNSEEDGFEKTYYSMLTTLKAKESIDSQKNISI